MLRISFVFYVIALGSSADEMRRDINGSTQHSVITGSNFYNFAKPCEMVSGHIRRVYSMQYISMLDQP